MSLQDIFNVSVTSSSRTPTRQGFGVALVLAYHTRWGSSPDRVRGYSSPAACAADGFRTSDPAYQMVATAFAQNPAPTSVKVGRRTSAFTQTINLTPSSPGIGEVFGVEVDGLAASYTADGTPTVAEVATGVAAAIAALADVDAIIIAGVSTAGLQTLTGASLDGAVGGAVMSPPRMLSFTFSAHANWDATTGTVTGLDVDGITQTETFSIPDGGGATVNLTKHFRRVTSVAIPAQAGTAGTFTMGTRAPVTASGSSATHIACTSVAGQIHSFKVTTGNLSIADVTTDPGIAADLAACLTADTDWYGLCVDSNSEAEIEAAAAWAESNGKLFVCQSADAACYDGSSTTDVFADLEATAYGRTTAWFYPHIGLSTGWLAAGILGSRMPVTPGSDTWAFKTIAGVTVYTLTDTQAAAIEAKNANWYQTLAGVNVTYPGKVSGDEWVDIVRFLDKRRAAQRERLFALNLAAQKNPFTDRGVSAVRAELAADIKEGQRDGGFDIDATPTITVPKVADVSTANRQARHLPGVTWSMRLAGAIHSMEVTGTATV